MSRPRHISDAQILAEARACFIEQGASVSTQVIAERLGISHAVIFQRFGTKEQLMRAALAPPGEEAWLRRIQAGPDARGLREQLLELGGHTLAFLEQVIPSVAMLRAAGLNPFPESQRPAERPPVRARRELVAWFRRARTRWSLGDFQPEHAVDLFLGAMQARPFHHHVSGRRGPRRDDPDYIAFAVEALVAAISKRPRAARPARAKPSPRPVRKVIGGRT